MTRGSASGAPALEAVELPQQIAELAELGVLTASLLHELRQPLFAVKGTLQLARHDGRAVGPDELELLLHQVAHIEELLEHYAGLGRPDDSWTEVDLRIAMQRVIAMLGHRIRQQGARVELVAGDEALVVHGRAVAVRQVVLNLLGNALDAVDGDEHPAVELRLLRDGRCARLEVTDRGPGLPPMIRDRLFEPFVTTKPPGRGTGLGLYIARKLAGECGGTVAVESPPEGGTRMVVLLPLSRA